MSEYDFSRAFEIIAERKITEAMEEGKFDNLPGKGEPLQIDPQWLIPPHLRIAATILHNAEVLPEWAQTDREIVMAREAIGILRRRVQTEYPLRCEKPQFPQWYANILQTLLRLMRRVNDLILQYNISSPTKLHVHAPFAVDREIQMFLAEFPPPESLNIPRVLSEASRGGAVRVEAQARYERIQAVHKEASPMQVNRELAQIFRFLANALEWQGENVFKIRAYRLAADTLEALDEPVQELVARNALRDLPHIGEAVDKKVRQYLTEGTFPALERMKAQVPVGIQKLLNLPGMTGRAVRALQERLGVEDVDSLRRAVLEGKIQKERWTPAVRETLQKAIDSY